MKEIWLEIRGKYYVLEALTGSIYEYSVSAGGPEDGDIEGWECVGKMIRNEDMV